VAAGADTVRTTAASGGSGAASPSSERVFARRALIASVIGGGVLAALLLLRALSAQMLVLFAGVLFAVLLSGLASVLSAWSRMRYRWSLAVVVLVLVTMGAAAVAMGGPRLAEQLDDLRGRVPTVAARLRGWLEHHAWSRDVFTHGGKYWNEVADQTGKAVSLGVGVVGNGVVVFFLGLFLAAEPRVYRHGVLALVPARAAERTRDLMTALGTSLRWWLAGRALTMVVVGTVTGLGLAALGIPLAGTLGLLAGLMNFVPYVGPIVAGVPAVALALTEGIRPALYVVALFLGVQTLEGYILTPLVDRRTVSLPPALTLSAQLVLGVLLGAGGVVLASPTLVCVLVWHRHWRRSRHG
jgi:predicted PurR-regulated permease PerM